MFPSTKVSFWSTCNAFRDHLYIDKLLTDKYMLLHFRFANKILIFAILKQLHFVTKIGLI